MCVCVCILLDEDLRIPGSGKTQIVPGVGASPKELDADLFQGLLLEASAGPFQGVQGQTACPSTSIPILVSPNSP